jgi:AhpD family alkylhydroperoxidase
MSESLYPTVSRDLAVKRKALSPETETAFAAFNQAAFAPGALPTKMKEIIAVAVAHVTQCPYCIKWHTKTALRAGATPQELMEAVWVASEMRAGAAYAHAALMLAAIGEEEARTQGRSQG